MHRRTSRGNRLGLTIVGGLLALTGAAAIATHLGLFGSRAAAAKVYPQAMSAWLVRNHWTYWVAAVVAVIIAGLALRWVIVQLRTDRLQRLSVDSERNTEPNAGVTVLSSGAVVDAVTADVEQITGVQKASAALSGAKGDPELWLIVNLHDDADGGAVRRQLVEVILPEARTALEKPDLHAYLTLNTGKRRTARKVH